jgi:hypothetical protein
VQELRAWIAYMFSWIGSFEKSGAPLPPHSRKMMCDIISL